MEEFQKEPFVYLNPALAKAKGIADLDTVRVFNPTGEVKLRAKITNTVPGDCLLVYEAWFRKLDFNVQNLVDDESADMGAYKTGAPGVAIHDQFADVARA